LSLTYKIKKIIDKEKIEYLENSILFCAVRMMYRGGMLLIEINQPYVGAYCLYYSKKLFGYKGLRSERESYENLEKSINSVIKTLNAEVKLILI
jgi:hypothetical protein